MKGTVQLGKDGIIYAKMVSSGDVEETKEWADTLKKLIKATFTKTKKKVLVLTDLSESTVANNIRVQSIITELEKEDAPYVEKSAAYTSNFTLRSLANIVAKISARRNFLVFPTKEEALGWLNEKKGGKCKADIIKETVHEVYKILKAKPDQGQEKVLDKVGRVHDYSGMETDEDFQSYTVQQGAVLIAFNFIKEKPSLSEAEAVDYILKHYSSMLSRYSKD